MQGIAPRIAPALSPAPPQPITTWSLVRPSAPALAGMAACTGAGALLRVALPLELGAFVNAVVAGTTGAWWVAGCIGTVVAIAVCFAVSDSLRTHAAARAVSSLRLAMAAGLGAAAAGASADGIVARFVSDVEGLEEVTVSVLDTAILSGAELVAAGVALGLASPGLLGVAAVGLLLTWVVSVRAQGPVVAAGGERQVALGALSEAVALVHGERRAQPAVLTDGIARVRRAETRLGVLRASNQQLSGSLAAVTPIAVVVAAATAQRPHAGTLLALYLVADRACAAADGLVDLRLDAQTARQAVRRCLGLAAPVAAEAGA